jgi:sortase A
VTRKILSALGAALLLCGLGVLSFIGIGAAADQSELAQKQQDTKSLVQEWDVEGSATRVDSPASAAPVQTPVTQRPGTYDEFGVLYMPRWGKDYVAPILEGDKSSDVSSWHGVDHYLSSQMPGELGNFVITGHNGRNETGRFSHLNQNEVGDLVYVETADGWYSYRLTSFETIDASESEVLLPVPRQPGVEPTKSTITLISCTRMWWGTTGRYVAYGDFEQFTPRADGPPADVSALR